MEAYNSTPIYYYTSIEEVMARQAGNINGKYEFNCTGCKHNVKSKGGYDTVGCKKNMFISTVGCNTINCKSFERRE